jgi:methionyl-tRNA formyltransferase
MTLGGKPERLKVLRSHLIGSAEITGTPGTVLDDELTVACASGLCVWWRFNGLEESPRHA